MEIQKDIQFWSHIMRDHAEFQYNSLAPPETEAINKAVYFYNLFDKLYNESRSNNTNQETLVNNSIEAIKQFIDFKRFLLSKLMTCQIKLRMTPTYMNQMINEAFEFLHVLNLANGNEELNIVLENIRIHKLWLTDASVHASTVAADLDAVESKLIKMAEDFADEFNKLFKKAYEMYTMYERTGLENGALQHFNEEVISTLTNFIKFLADLEKTRSSCKIYSTGTFSPLVTNHMIREEEYYIFRITQFSSDDK